MSNSFVQPITQLAELIKQETAKVEKAVREKVYIFDQGLDDRIIELMKLFIRIDISQKNPEHEVDKIFFEY